MNDANQLPVDIVQKLRERAGFARQDHTGTADADAWHFDAAADEIERLREATGINSTPVAYITKVGLEKFIKGDCPENHVLLRTGGDLRVALFASALSPDPAK